MAGLFVMPIFIKKRVAPAQFESRLYSTLLKKVEWTSEKMSFDAGQARNLGSLYKPTVEGYTALSCLGGSGNGTSSLICSLNGWVYNAGVKYSSVSVTYQWLFIKNS